MDNIQAGFHKIGIYPLDPAAFNACMGPSTTFGEEQGENEGFKGGP